MPARRVRSSVKRSAIVVFVLLVGITLMIWSGVVAYRARRATEQRIATGNALLVPPGGAPSPSQMTGARDAANEASDPGSPAEQGLPDFRGKQAPPFVLKTPEGKTVSLADYKGKAVLVNFWATTCPPCTVETPWLVELQKQYAPQGFTVIGISEDFPPFSQVSAFVQKMGMDYPVVLANDAVGKAYGGIDFLPTSYYIGRDGKVQMEIAGVISKAEMQANIEKILATKNNPSAKGA